MTSSANHDLRVLILAPFGKDATLIETVLRECGISAYTIPSTLALAAAIVEGAGAAIVTEEVLPDGSIGVLAQRLSEQPPWSDVPIIVLTGGGTTTAETEDAVRSRAPLGNDLSPAQLWDAARSACAR